MELNKPKFWNSKFSIFSYLLLPLSLLILIYNFLKKRIVRTRKFKIPIVCIGNIYVGGTGKTPACILIAQEMTKLGKNPVILKKFYKNQIDEQNLIEANYNNLILNKDRAKGIEQAENNKFDSVILDDGFQDFKLKTDLNIICFNSNQLIGNGFVIPSGPLRESLRSLKNANLVLINGNKNNDFENKIFEVNDKIKIFYSYYKPVNLDEFKNKKLLAIAGIGNPENFFKLIENYKLQIEKKLVFPDHHSFSKREIQEIIDRAKKEELHIIMTEKDYFKVNKFKIDKVNYLKVSLEILKKNEFMNIVSKVYD